MKELTMDKSRQEQVIIALKEKGATHACPRCGNLEFEVIGEAGIPLSPPRGSFWGGPTPEIPVILVSCNNCGYIAQHATRLLELKR
jgi:predicted RNA-binding Zn-ribbon protein involved in translation (DUF1610 family)